MEVLVDTIYAHLTEWTSSWPIFIITVASVNFVWLCILVDILFSHFERQWTNTPLNANATLNGTRDVERRQMWAHYTHVWMAAGCILNAPILWMLPHKAKALQIILETPVRDVLIAFVIGRPHRVRHSP
jgi:hypothetical protein